MKKKLIFIIILWSFCCSVPMAVAAEEQGFTFRAGVELFNKKLYEPAYKIFLLLFENNPENSDINFYLGRSAFEIGNYEMAVMAFERILIASSSQPRVKLEIARAFQKLGANNIARKYCSEVLAEDVPETVKLNIKKFLLFIDQSEKVHFINGQVSAGIDWNNNVWTSPSGNTVKTVIGDIKLTGSSSKKTRDYIYNTTFALNHTYRPLYSKQSWNTQAVIYQGLYNKTSDLDTLYVSGQTGPQFNIGKNTIKLSAMISQLELDNSKYESAIGLQASFAHSFNSGLILTTAIEIREHNYPASPLRDSVEKNILLDIGLPYLDNWFNIGLKATRETAFDDEYTYYEYTGFATASRQFFKNIIGSVSYEYQYAGYEKPTPLFAKNRMDQLHFAGCSLRKKIWQSRKQNMENIFLNLSYQHIWAFSNIPLYEYTKDLIQLSLTYNF